MAGCNMNLPIFLLPFDHRSSFAHDFLDTTYPIGDPLLLERAQALKLMIAEAMINVAKRKPDLRCNLAILTDPDLGRRAWAMIETARIFRFLPLELGGKKELELITGQEIERLVREFRPTGLKLLVNYQPLSSAQGQHDLELILAGLQQARANNLPLILELLLPEKEHSVMTLKSAVYELLCNGVHPDIWKVEGLETVAEWKELKEITQAPTIMLGRGAEFEKIKPLVKIAAESGAVDGIAIGRSIFGQPLKGYTAGMITAKLAEQLISENFLEIISIWEKGRELAGNESSA